jgi:signal transduction histidine kinase
MMKKRLNIFHPIFVFIMAQLAWLSLLGLWIYWYVTNYIIFKQVGENYSPQLLARGTNVLALVSGLILLVFVLAGMYFIFIYLTRQLSLTKLYDNFIANVTHELKSPLASILLYLETLNERQVPENRRRQFISLMVKDVNRLQNLINSILKLSGIEKKKMIAHYRIYHIGEVVTSLVEEAVELFKLDPDSVKIEGDASCVCVIDRDALKIVIDNLIDNAIKFTPGPFRMAVQIGCTSKTFILKIIDQGIGILPNDQKKIFYRFFRINKQNVPDIRGTGLGLHIASEIINAHGGNISVFSAGVNKGSTFSIELPIYQVAKKRYLSHLLKVTNRMEKEKNVE